MVFRPGFTPDFGESPEIEEQIQERIRQRQREGLAGGNDRPEPDADEQAAIDAENARRQAEEEARRKAEEEEAERKAKGYPKTLYNSNGEPATVNSEEEEAFAKRAGYTLTTKPTPPPATPPPGGGGQQPPGGGGQQPPGGGGGGGAPSNVGYPKDLWNEDGDKATVNNAQEEGRARQGGYRLTSPPPAPTPVTLYKTLFKRDPDGTLQTISIPYLQGQDDTWKAYTNGQGWFEQDPGVAEAPFEPVEYNQGGTWYKISGYPGVSGDTYAIEYTLDSGRKIYYLASKSELDSIFGEGQTPPQVTNETWANFSSPTDRFFGGAASEVIGSNDNFATRVTRVIQSGGTNELPLPDFVQNNQDLLDIFFLAVAEGKSESWLLREMSKVQAFKDEFPGIDTIYAQTQDWKEAVNTWNTFSSEITKLNVRYGETVDVSDLVSAAVTKGYNIQDIQKTYEIFDKAEQNSDFLTAFQSIIDQDPDVTFDVTTPQGIVDFFEGKAPTEIYDLYEASSIQQQATRFELGINAEGAIQLALQTPGQITQQNIAQSLQQAAIQIARFREDIDANRYGLTEQVIINSALGVKTPGISEIEIQDAFSKIFQENQALQQNQPFVLNEQSAVFRGQREIRSV